MEDGGKGGEERRRESLVALMSSDGCPGERKRKKEREREVERIQEEQDVKLEDHTEQPRAGLTAMMRALLAFVWISGRQVGDCCARRASQLMRVGLRCLCDSKAPLLSLTFLTLAHTLSLSTRS